MSGPVFARSPFILIELVDNDGDLGFDLTAEPLVDKKIIVKVLRVVAEALENDRP